MIIMRIKLKMCRCLAYYEHFFVMTIKKMTILTTMKLAISMFFRYLRHRRWPMESKPGTAWRTPSLSPTLVAAHLQVTALYLFPFLNIPFLTITMTTFQWYVERTRGSICSCQPAPCATTWTSTLTPDPLFLQGAIKIVSSERYAHKCAGSGR